MAQRLQQEEHKVHVIAPPRMGGAKLNILYTVGDVPISVPQKGIQTQPPPPTPTENSCPAPLTRTLSADQPPVQTPPHSAHKDIRSNSEVNGDNSSRPELTKQSSYAKTTDTLYEEHERY